MPIKAVQQFMLGTVLNNEQQAKETLAAMKAALSLIHISEPTRPY